MDNYSDKAPDWDGLRLKIIGLGDTSIRKNYYPELQKRLHELERSNSELNEVVEELQCKEEELSKNLEELKEVQSSLAMARKKQTILNTLTFQDIQNALFSLHGYMTLINEGESEDLNPKFMEKSLDQVRKIGRSLNIAKHFQEMGIHPPKWYNLLEIFLYAISRLNLSNYKRDLKIEGLYIFTDPLIEEVLYYIIENICEHSMTATQYSIYYKRYETGIDLIIEDNGVGIEDYRKEIVFTRESCSTNGIGLFLVREILSITDIRIFEDGIYGKGARFVLKIPEGRYRVLDKNNDLI
jgi:K+-sensing histidine kinase KdpD